MLWPFFLEIFIVLGSPQGYSQLTYSLTLSLSVRFVCFYLTFIQPFVVVVMFIEVNVIFEVRKKSTTWVGFEVHCAIKQIFF